MIPKQILFVTCPLWRTRPCNELRFIISSKVNWSKRKPILLLTIMQSKANNKKLSSSKPGGKKALSDKARSARKDQASRAVEKLKVFEDILESKRIAEKRSVKVGQMMIAPGKGELVKAPTFSAAKGATRRFTRTFTLAPGVAGSKFGVRVQPALRNFVHYSAKDETIVTGPSLMVSGIAFTSGAIVTYTNITTMSEYITETIGADVNGQIQIPWQSTSVGSPGNVSVINAGSKPVRVYWATKGTVTDSGITTTNLGPYGDYSGATLAPGAGDVAGIMLKVDSADEGVYFKFTDTAATSINQTSTAMSLIEDEWLDLGQVERYRVSACSVLATYRGNLLEGAGVIAALRTANRWIPRGVDLYSSICSVPEDRYKGPLHQGAYVWWLPYDGDELDFRPPRETVPEGNCLYIAGQIDDPQGALEVTVDMVVDFYSPLQIFERKIFPPMTDEYHQMLHYLSTLESATCNPKHLDTLKKVIRGAGQAAYAGASWLVAHPEYARMLLEGIASLA